MDNGEDFEELKLNSNNLDARKIDNKESIYNPNKVEKKSQEKSDRESINLSDDNKPLNTVNNIDFNQEVSNSKLEEQSDNPPENNDNSGTINNENNQNINSEDTKEDIGNNDKLSNKNESGYNRSADGREAYQRKLDNGKNYYDDKLNKNREEQDKLKNNKEQNKNRRDSAEKRLEQAKQNRTTNKNKNTKSDLRDAEQEDKEAKKESKEQKKEEKNLKKEEKSIQKDSKKADRFKKMHPVEAAKMSVKNKVDKIKKIIIAKVAVVCLPIVLGLFLAFFVIELILGPLMEVWGHIDEAITKAADFSEKLTNFYNGFGFQDTKEAFYEEINELNEKYDSNLDIPLLLSTLFYTEGMGYDTEFGKTEAADAIDGSVTGSNAAILSGIREYLKEKFDEAQQTIDENGLVYNVGKIYRLRKLARNQFYTNAFGLTERKGIEKTVPLSEFLKMYAGNIAKDIEDLLTDMIGMAFSSISTLFNELCALILGSEYSGSFLDNLGQIAQDFKDTFLQLISDIFYGLADITNIDLSLVGDDGIFTVKITYRQFSYDEENYTNYLMDYYLDKMPEFDELLPDDKTAREEKKKQIITEIYENRDLFKDIFLQYIDTDAEAYTNACVGAIDNKLVSELSLPVKIPDGTTISFTNGTTAFGIRDGKNHNGVDLNSSTAGVDAGADVFAIADGKVEDVGTSSNSVTTSSSISNYLFIGDSRYVGISNELKSLGQNNTVAAVTSSTPLQWENVAKNGQGVVRGDNIVLPSSADGISIMLGVNAVNQTSNLQNIVNSLHTRYPNAQIYVNSVYHVGTKYTGSVTNDAIDTFNQTMKTWCDAYDWVTYIDVTEGLNDSNGYVKSEYMDGAGLHATGTGKTILVNNIKKSLGGTINDTYGSWIKLSHDVVIDNKEYKFYSVYRNLDSVTLKKGNSVSKESKIGIIGSSSDAHLHFEFYNENDNAIDPTNLFIKCSSSTELVGNTNEEKTWNYLLSKGFTKVAAAGIIGNLIAETGLLPNNVENASMAQSLLGDEKFTEMVDNGSISREEFIKSSKYAVPKGWHGYNYDGYIYGYGLAQWTDPGRKTKFYDFWSGPNSGISIGDLGLQLDFIMIELDGDYSSTKESVNKASTPTEAADIFWHYEIGAAKDLRRKYADQIYNQFANQ